MTKTVSVKDQIQEIVAKKKEAYQAKMPQALKDAVQEICEHNDCCAPHERVNGDDAVEILAKLGFVVNRNSLTQIAKQLGRSGYAKK